LNLFNSREKVLKHFFVQNNNGKLLTGLDTKNRSGKIKVWDNEIQIEEGIRII
jgi:hypothetical protein